MSSFFFETRSKFRSKFQEELILLSFANLLEADLAGGFSTNLICHEVSSPFLNCVF